MAPNRAAHSTSPTDDPIKTATGKRTQEWVSMLDQWCSGDATEEVVIRYLVMQHKLPSFWAQAIAKRYLTAVGENQRAGGS